MDYAVQQRLLRYLALGVAEDELDWTAHDKRYHGGHFDPKTMTCKERQDLEKGDKADAIPRPDGQTAFVRSPLADLTAGERYGKYRQGIDDGSGWQPYFSAKLSERHAASEAAQDSTPFNLSAFHNYLAHGARHK